MGLDAFHQAEDLTSMIAAMTAAMTVKTWLTGLALLALAVVRLLYQKE